ncbi:MAG: peptide chain release factor N(5)-glutamine methyltransferase [Desulfovibrio sp.]|nr:peptide chain release factor N(5)-glutamine methyltransferase [Desulfovibrio sp.]
MRIKDAIDALSVRFKAQGMQNARYEAKLIIAASLGLTQLMLCVEDQRHLSKDELTRIKECGLRRMQGEPLSYIAGKKEFYGLEFLVSPATLIPRPETELLVDLATENTASNQVFADLGTGCGNIGIAIANQRPHWQGFLIEKSWAALSIAQKNCQRLVPTSRLVLLAMDWSHFAIKARSFHLMVANPPYIAASELALVQKDVLNYEPHTSLFSANEGLADIATIIAIAKHSLKPKGRLLLEHGYKQGESVAALCREHGFRQIHTHQDLAGLDRVTSAQFL